MQPSFGTILTDALRVLTFRSPSAAIATHWPSYLAFGLLCTWAAGMGRYWDNPRAEWWQTAGLGSIAYVFCLSLFLWLLVLPLRPARWSYASVLTFVTLTSPPALLYAIPVEQFMTMSGAQSANAWFLAIVALWRMALLIWFLQTITELSVGAVVAAAFLPIVLIIVALSALNLEHVVFRMMSGSRADRSPSDLAYLVVVALSMISVVAAPFLLATYVWQIIEAWRRT